MEVTLAAVDRSNFEECIRLRLDPSQTDFTPPVAYSLAEAKVDPSCVPLAIEAGEAVVGFAMYQRDPEAPALAPATYWIMRFMINAEHQRRGYGRAALGLLLERLKALPDCTGAALSYHPDNGVAKSFYAGFGFVENGPVPWGRSGRRCDGPRKPLAPSFARASSPRFPPARRRPRPPEP